MNIHLFLRLPLLSCISLLILVDACRPANDISQHKCLVGSISSGEDEYIDKGKLTFDYDANRRLTKATLSFRNTQTTSTQSFSYSPGRIAMQTIPVPVESGVVSATYSLNTAGYVTKIRSTERVYGSESPRLTEQRFFYTEDGYLKAQEDDSDRSNEYTYFQDNFYVDRVYLLGILWLAYNFSNYTDKPFTINPLKGVSTFTPFYAQGLFGKAVKNAIKATSNLRGTTEYSYTYDDKGNVTRLVQTDNSPNGKAVTLNYTYLCP